MDVNRAKAIIESTERFEVTLGGEKVWIDSVDSTTKTATVHVQYGAEQESKTCRVDELLEVRDRG